MLSSVDSLASAGGGIVIQVLGELSNRDEPSQKFAETFFLAEQPNGYFVLNDIFRYLKEDIESDYDDIEAEPPRDTGQSSTHGLELGDDGLVNGFHSNSTRISLEHTFPRPMNSSPITDQSLAPQASAEEAPFALRKSENEPEISTVETDLKTAHSDSVEPELNGSAQFTAPEGSEVDSALTHDVPQAHDMKSDPRVIPDHQVPAVTQPAAPTKSWATLAATNSEKWHAPQDQRSSGSAISTHPKISSTQSNRKDVQKASATGNHGRS
jgi:hypothetical protein